MKTVPAMLIICLFVMGLVFAVSTPGDRRHLHSASSEIVKIIERNLVILWDKMRGIDSYYMEDDEEEDIQVDPFDIEIGDSGILDSDDSVDVKVKWDDGR